MWKMYLLCAFVVLALSTFVIGLRGQRKGDAPAATSTAAVSNPPSRQAESPVKNAATKDQPLQRNEPPITNAEAEALAAAISTAVTSGDTEAFGAQFDFAAFGKLLLGVIDANTVEANRLRAEIEEGLRPAISKILDQVVHQVHSGGSYQYLRTVDREEGPRLIFRLITSRGSLNYHEVIVARRPEGVRAVDFFIYASAERMSESMQRMLLMALPRDMQTRLA